VEPQCTVRLDIFEGPLDLLLHLINKNRLDITDIPISLVTNQYLQYLELLQALDIEVAAEYLLMAATLIHIKSRMLLPKRQEVDADEEDPRLQITIALQELKKAKELADKLDSRPVLGRDVFVNSPQPAELEDDEQEPEGLVPISVFELVEAFKKVLKQGGLPKTIEIEKARIRLSERIKEIEKKVYKEKRLSFFGLFSGKMERFLIIVTFLAILELSKRGVIRLFQKEGHDDIIIVKRKSCITSS